MTQGQECAHPACNCPVPEGESYRSTYCHDASSTVELMCNCGDAGCAEKMAHSG